MQWHYPARRQEKIVLYVRFILTDLGLTPDGPTNPYVDISGAIFMINAQAPTKRTRHVDIRFFALLQWSQTQQITALPICTTDHQNISDSMTKCTGRIKFHQHADIYMGRIPPTYVTTHHRNLTPIYLHALQDTTEPRLDALTVWEHGGVRDTVGTRTVTTSRQLLYRIIIQ